MPLPHSRSCESLVISPVSACKLGEPQPKLKIDSKRTDLRSLSTPCDPQLQKIRTHHSPHVRVCTLHNFGNARPRNRPHNARDIRAAVMSKTDPDCASQRGKASLAHENEQARSEPLAAETETGAGGRFGLRTTSADEESCSGELQDGERRPGLSNAGTFSDSQIGVSGPSLSMAAPVHTLVPTNTNINTNTSTNFHAATHPEGYVAPSSYLRRYSKPVSMLVAMPETAVDRDQQRGLVCPSSPFPSPNDCPFCCAPTLWYLCLLTCVSKL